MQTTNLSHQRIKEATQVASFAGLEGDKYRVIVSREDGVISTVVLVKKTPVVPPTQCNKHDFDDDLFKSVVELDGEVGARIYRRTHTVEIFITRRGATMVDNLLSGKEAEDSGIKGVVSGDMKLFFGDLLLELSRFILPRMNGKIGMHVKGEFSIQKTMVILSKIPGFANDLAVYREMSDGPVHLYNNENIAQYVDSNNLPLQETYSNLMKVGLNAVTYVPGDPPAYTPNEIIVKESELDALVYTYLFCMVKTGKDEYVREALEKRLKTFKVAFTLKDLNTQDFLSKFFSNGDYALIYEGMSLYPNLKSLIFSSVLGNTINSKFKHIRIILKDSQLTIYNMIVAFCHTTDYTSLHIYDEVLKEYAVFANSFAILIKRYGNAWPFCKLVNPTEDVTALNQFPKLAQAAKAYTYVLTGQDSLKNLKGMKTVPHSYFIAASVSLGTSSRVSARLEEINKALSCVKRDLDFNVTEEMINDVKNILQTKEVSPEVVRMLGAARVD